MKYTQAENNLIADVIRQNFRLHAVGKHGKDPRDIKTGDLLPKVVSTLPDRYPVAKNLDDDPIALDWEDSISKDFQRKVGKAYRARRG